MTAGMNYIVEFKKKPNGSFIRRKLATEVILDCIKKAVHKFKTTLRFKQYDVILTKISVDQDLGGQICYH